MSPHEMEIVNALRLAIAEKIGHDRFELWLRGAQLDVLGQNIRIAIGSEFTLGWLRNNLRSEIEDACASVIGAECAVEFRHDPSLASQATKPKADSTEAKPDPQSPAVKIAAQVATPSNAEISTRKKFAKLSTFVPGRTNRVSISSAEMVAENPGSVSPLFLYGPTGVGKSHLAQGIWSSMRRSPERLRTVYLSAEQFTTYFIQALNGSGLPSFRRRYRHVDLLIVEDIQFFAGKRATLTELQHTIDSVLREGKQLVLTADRSPADLVNLGPEMVNRLSGGLVVRVELPDLEARGEIIRRAARERGLMVPEDVVGLIAERMPGDVRQLNGALNRLQVTSHAWRKPISMEMAANALEDVFRSSVRVVRLEDIEKAVCNVFEVTPSNLRSSSKTRKVSHPRMLAMFLARKYTRAGLTEIGSYFGRRSHATVVSATKKVELWKTKGSSVRLTDHECPVEEALRQVERRMLG